MAEDRVETRELNWRQLMPWTELFRGFQVALDLNKLLLAAAGIFMMAFGWWLLAVIFSAGYNKEVPPDWPSKYRSEALPVEQAWTNFRADRDNWNLMNEAAGLTGSDNPARWEVKDLAGTYLEFVYFGPAEELNRPSWKDPKDPGVRTGKEYLDRIETLYQDYRRAREAKKEDNGFNEDRRKEYLAKAAAYARLGQTKPTGRLATWPWSEDRGPNPFLLATGQSGIPWEAGHFWDWLTTQQVPVLIEPLAKLVRPVLYFLSPRATGWLPIYFLCVFLWTVLTWSIFGGAITRIAAVQLTRGEKIGLMEALRFTFKRRWSYLTPPLFPLVGVALLVVGAVIFGAVGMIPLAGDILVSGVLWPIPLVLGLIMAVLLVGLAIGWPLMAPTISTEGTDSWEAVSRSLGYIFNKPGHYLWYCLVAIVYGAAVVFLIGFLGSFTIYMGKWAVALTPLNKYWNREPSYLFVYAPTSFQWRTLLLDGAQVEGRNVVQDGKINDTDLKKLLNKDPEFTDERYTMRWWNKVGAGLVAFWLGLVFLLILGFGYSYYFTASTIIYLLMRKNVDGAEMDEVYLEDENLSGTYPGPLTPPLAPANVTKPNQPVTMVESPTLRAPSAAVTAPLPPASPAPPPPPPPSAPPPPPAEPTAKDGTDNPPPAAS